MCSLGWLLQTHNLHDIVCPEGEKHIDYTVLNSKRKLLHYCIIRFVNVKKNGGRVRTGR